MTKLTDQELYEEIFGTWRRICKSTPYCEDCWFDKPYYCQLEELLNRFHECAGLKDEDE